MKTTFILLSACLGVMVLAGVVTVVGVHRSNQQLRAANQKLETELDAARALTDILRSEKQETARQMTQLREASELLQSQILEVANAAAEEAAAATNRPAVSPYQAQAYLGRELLGSAWIIPRNMRMDKNAQRYVYEPVIVLDDKLRSKFVTSYTNVIEREFLTTPVENNYYAQSLAYGGPIISHHRGRDHHAPPPQVPGPPQPAPKFDPGNGTTTPQRLGTPPGKTRPQMPNKTYDPTR